MVPEDIKINIRSVLLSQPNGVPMDELIHDYKKLVCSHLNVRGLGYNNLGHLLESIPDVARVAEDPQSRVRMVYAVDKNGGLAYVNPAARKALRKSDVVSSLASSDSFTVFVGNLPSAGDMEEGVLKTELRNILSGFTVLNLRIKTNSKIRFAFFDTNSADGNAIIKKSRCVSIRNKHIIFDKSSGTNPDTGRVGNSFAESMSRPPLLPLPTRPPLLPLPNCKELDMYTHADVDGKYSVELCGFPHNTQQKRLYDTLNMNRLRFKTVKVLQSKPPDSTRAIITFNDFEDALAITNVILYIDGHQLTTTLQLPSKDLLSVTVNADTRKVEVSADASGEKPTRVSLLESPPRAATQPSVLAPNQFVARDITASKNGNGEKQSCVRGLSQNYAGHQPATDSRVVEQPSSSNINGLITKQISSHGLTGQQSVSDSRVFTQSRNTTNDEISTMHGASQGFISQQSVSDTCGIASPHNTVVDRLVNGHVGSQKSAMEPHPRLPLQQLVSDVRQLSTGHTKCKSSWPSGEQQAANRPGQCFDNSRSQPQDKAGHISSISKSPSGLSNQNFGGRTSNQPSKFGNNPFSPGSQREQFGQINKLAGPSGGRSAFANGGNLSGINSFQLTSGEGFQSRTGTSNQKAYSHGSREHQQIKQQLQISAGDVKTSPVVQASEQQFPVKELPSDDLDLSDLPPLELFDCMENYPPSLPVIAPAAQSYLQPCEPITSLQLKENIHLAEASFSGGKLDERQSSTTMYFNQTSSDLSSSRVIKSPVNSVDYSAGGDNSQQSLKVGKPINSPTTASSVNSRSPARAQVCTVPADLDETRLDKMLRDCFIHAGLVSLEELANPVQPIELMIVYIDPSDPQFFWALIMTEPYLSEASELVTSLKDLPVSMPHFKVSTDQRRRASVVYEEERTRVWIESVDGECARVMFVDYGNADTVPLSDLQVLPDIYWRIRPVAVPFRLLHTMAAVTANHVVQLTSEHLNMHFTAKLRDLQQKGLGYVIDVESLVLNLELA